jgi:hypothetical protein
LKLAVAGTAVTISDYRLAIEIVRDNDGELTVTVSGIGGRFVKTRFGCARTDASKV